MKKLLYLTSLFAILNVCVVSAQEAPKTGGTATTSGTIGTNANTEPIKKKKCCKKKKKAKAIVHPSPNQAQLDSIKKAKTEGKFK